jgi:hypothetical protein
MLVHHIRPPDVNQLKDLQNRIAQLKERRVNYRTNLQRGHINFCNAAADLADLVNWDPHVDVPNILQNKIEETRNEADFQYTRWCDALYSILLDYSTTEKDLNAATDRLCILEATPIQPVEIKFETQDLVKRYPEHIKDIKYDMTTGVMTVYTKALVARLTTKADSKFSSVTGELPIPPLRFILSLKEPAGSLGKLRFAPVEFSYHNTFVTDTPHPHVLANNKPCLGDFQTVISDAFDSGDIDMLLMVIFSFIEQVNADGDQAGESWPNMFIKNREVWQTTHSGVFNIRDMTFTTSKKVPQYE